MDLPQHIRSSIIVFFGANDSRQFLALSRVSRDWYQLSVQVANSVVFGHMEDYSNSTIDLFGNYHSVNDQPAFDDGPLTKWYWHGQIHRDPKDDLPAEVGEFYEKWYLHGRVHRDTKDANGLTKPAIIRASGIREWRKNGQCHRDEKSSTGEDLPAIDHIDGDGPRVWFRNGKLHRDTKDPVTGEILPAVIEPEGGREWWTNGTLVKRAFIRDPNRPHEIPQFEFC